MEELPPTLLTPRATIGALAPSRIRQIANAAMGRADVAAFWFGESDQPTPDFIRTAAKSSLDLGQTFYTQNLGRPVLREAIARYVSDLHGVTVSPGQVAVTGSGVSALMLVAQMLVSPGDRVVMVTPIWPNIAEIPRILGAEVVRVPLRVREGKWSLDVDELIDALTPDTQAVVINSPNNPTGWTIETEQQAAILAHCRKHGIWVVSDDVYERLVYGGGIHAPSFLMHAGTDERLISVNSFSKAWRMTGWRIGWLLMPEALMDDLAKVIEYNTSCVADFSQQAALIALDPQVGEAAVRETLSGLDAARRQLLDGLTALRGVEIPEAEGAMYAFFRIAGRDDDMALARDLIDRVGLGLAPGSSFGAEGAGWLRWCFAASEARIADGLERLERFLL